MQFCQICGNATELVLSCCPFCGCDQENPQQGQFKSKKFYQKTINLEQGLPTVEQALLRLRQELAMARMEKIRLLTLIHGYGSTGKGGGIRRECRKTLDFLKGKGDIDTVIFGEDFSRRRGAVKHLLSRFPELSSHPHLNHQNKGITLVFLF
ncbi:MAG: Smr/MutS family protein [Desulfocapsa sp.]|nr:Smr/MutS family protein [Desulfocapsa sp.]